ncbi:Intraflagellar transport protein 81 homolog [Strongyloides ratti]|uniref:Intraflagellar transport protein 81 homolog n=1 Tax=Strongyloides ratti TaxID=34506 RepID=A0A090LL49_STRRB|nr:Intraflagellar transport protein 81 homolog [Strongyloides ratti]CEF70549.1 Intraflagellar transport protein 81 homolog [Strongyloides ratti]
MSVENIRKLVTFLNAPPFSKNLNLITFDSLKNDKLLQLLSDVLQWITNDSIIDIRSESAEETAIRIFNALRLIRFRAPKDLDELQDWRTGIIEGEKCYIYPILYWVFTNQEKIRERVYLSHYLTKVNIPPEFKDDEIIELENEVNQVMEQFKETHKAVKDVKFDSLLIQDIKNDLNTMSQEKEQLNRRVEKVKKKVMNIKGYEKYLKLAKQLRIAKDEGTKYRALKFEQETFISNYSGKKKRLERDINEIENNINNMNPSQLIKDLEEEIDSYTYILTDKLQPEIENKQRIIHDLTQIANMKTITKEDILEMNKNIDNLNADIMNLTLERDNKDEANDDKLSIYRHQAANIARKKSVMAEILQRRREDLTEVENELNEKKKRLKEKYGGGEVVSSVEMKKYISKFRAKTFEYKKRKGTIDNMKREIGILNGTLNILNREWNIIKKDKENKKEIVIETILKQPVKPKGYERPKTGKVKTRNVDELKKLINDMENEIEFKKNEGTTLNDQLLSIHEKINRLKKLSQEKDNDNDIMEINKMEGLLERITSQVSEESRNVERHQEYVNKIKDDLLVPSLENEEKSLEEEKTLLIKEMDNLRRQEQSVDQIEMWKGIQEIFDSKLAYFEKFH